MTTRQVFQPFTLKRAWRWPRWVPQSVLVSQQRIDPLGSLSAWPLAPIVAVSLTFYSIYSTIQQGDQIVRPILAVAAIGLCIASVVVHCFAARPSSSHYGGPAFATVFVLAVAAMSAQVASTWGANALLQDDFGHIALAVLLAAVAPYRPAVQIVSLAVVGAACAGVLAALQSPYFVIVGVPPIERAVVAMVPVLGLGLGGAAYANQLGRAVLDWQRTAVSSEQAHETGVFDGLARTVQQEQLAALSDEVLPFLASVAAQGELTPSDSDRARRLARAVRASLVAELNHSWLEQLQMQPQDSSAVKADADAPSLTVRDEHRRAFRMPGEQRTAVAALLSEISTNVRLAASEVTVSFEPDATHPASRTRARLQARLRGRDQQAVTLLRPYLSVLRLLFKNCSYAVRGGILDVKFSYDHERSGKPTGEQHSR